MKAYVLQGVGQLEYKDVPLPDLKPGWVLVRTAAAGICQSDIPRIFQTGTYHFPTVPGHEFAGTVTDVYGEESRAWLGKRVGVFPLIPCNKCFVCKEKNYEMCRSYDYLGSRRDGGFAEYVAVPQWNLIELPDEMSMKEAAMLEPASVALHAVRRLDLAPGMSAALYGLGTIGLIITQWLHILGVKNVYAVGRHAAHGRIMQKTAGEGYLYVQAEKGQDTVSWILEQTGGMGTDAAIDCTGTAEGISNCLRCVRPGGQVLAVGNPKGDIVLDQASYWKILRNQLRVTGTWNSSFCHYAGDDWHKTIEACVNGTLHLTELITHSLAFDELKQGLSIARERKEYLNKIMICESKNWQ